MKYLFAILAVSFMLSSCGSTYFYTTISSLDYDMAQNDDGDFISENDSVLVAYWFNGENAPIFINVYNKTETPLYVDWAESSLIIGNNAMSYDGNIINISDEYGNRYEDEISFVPPRSRVTFNTMPFVDLSYDNIPDKNFSDSKIPDKDGLINKVKILDFDENNTPLRFRSFLTLYKNPDNPFTAEHEFFVSKVIKSKDLTPKSITDDLFKRGDLFYTIKESKNKHVLGNVLLGTALAGLVVVGVVWGDSEAIYYEDSY